jgi:hypothetical protein
MSEIPTLPSEADKLDWAEGPGEYTVTDPGSSKRTVGWKPKDEPTPGPGDIVPAVNFNWLQRTVGRMLEYFLAGSTRNFEDIHEAFDAGIDTVNQTFRITPGLARGTNIFNTAGQATGSSLILDRTICTDGRRIYYAGGAGSQYILGVKTSDGTKIWEDALGSGSTTGLCTDGKFVYASGTVLTPQRFDCIDGTQDSPSGPTETAIDYLATNGSYLVGANSNAGAGYVTFFSGIQGTMVEDGQVNTEGGGGTLTCICVDNDTVYVGGNRNNGYDVWAYNLSDRSLKWRTALTSASHIPRAIATDGNLVYIATDYASPDNFFAMNSQNGELSIAHQVGPAEDLDGVCVDDRYIMVSNATSNDIIILDKLFSYQQWVEIIPTSRDIKCCDGISVIGEDSGTGYLTRDLIGRPGKVFQVVADNDPHRRPFHHVAIPAGDH